MSERDDDMLLRRAAAIFRDAIEEEPARRSALLDARCGSDSALRARVESMLERDGMRASDRAHGATAGGGDTAALPGIQAIAGGLATNVLRDMVASPVVSGPDRSGRPLEPGDRVGRYVIERRIAEGGSSIVYEASQSEPARRVALKVHRFAILSADGLARFREETKILGHLRHAGIAHVYDASIGDGAASDIGAAHWIAMELVPEGMPLTRYCQTHHLEMRQRIELFRTVCDAVAHAHQRGVIHRDLKPANILVGSDGVPKVIDFGLGRLLDASAATRVTLHGQIFGTMEYMSPEQCAGDAMDVDVRSDVYGLGLCLYELVFDQRARDFSGRTPIDALREVSQSTIQPPVSKSGSVPRDLQTIVMHAVERERADRYQSVQALSDDLGRYLRAEPIQGRPTGVMRRLQLFTLRNKLVAALLMIASATLIAFLVTVPMLVQSARKNREEAARMQQEIQESYHAVTGFSLRHAASGSASRPQFVAIPVFGPDREASRGVAITAMPDDQGQWNQLVLIDRESTVVAALDLDLEPPADVVGSDTRPPVLLGSADIADLLPAHAGAEVILKFSSQSRPLVSAILILDMNLRPLSTLWTTGLIREVVWCERSNLLVMSLVSSALASFEPRFAAMDARMCVNAGGRVDIVPLVLALKLEALDGILLPARGREKLNLVRTEWAIARLPDEFENNRWRGRYCATIADDDTGEGDAVARIDVSWAAHDGQLQWPEPKRLFSAPIDSEGELVHPFAAVTAVHDAPAPPRFAPIDFSALQIAASLPREGLEAMVAAIEAPDDDKELVGHISEAPPPFSHHPEVVRLVVKTMGSNWRDLHVVAEKMMRRPPSTDPAEDFRKSLVLAERAQELHDLRCPDPDECQAACYCRSVLAESHYHNGRIAEALELLERVESTWRKEPIPSNPIEFVMTLAWKTLCLAEFGRYDEARTAFAEGAVHKPDCKPSDDQVEHFEELLARAAKAIDASAAPGHPHEEPVDDDR